MKIYIFQVIQYTNIEFVNLFFPYLWLNLEMNIKNLINLLK